MIIEEMSQYEQMRDDGAPPEEIYCAARLKHGKDAGFLHLMRHVFQVSKEEAYQLIHRCEEHWFQHYVAPPYIRMHDSGATPHEVYRAARADQANNQLDCWRILRIVFGLGLVEVKEVTVQANGVANSLDEYYEKLADVLDSIDVDKLMNDSSQDNQS